MEQTTKNAYVTWTPDICIYHGKCDDGFGAAWVVQSKWPDVKLIPASHGQPLPTGYYDNKNVIFVDFSLPKDELIKLAKIAKSIVILDHHITALDNLSSWNYGPVTSQTLSVMSDIFDNIQGFPIVACFDQELSGVGMAWKFCYPDDKLPQALAYIQDRDLWKFQFGDKTKQFSAALRMYEQDITVWNYLIKNPEQLVVEGIIALRVHEHQCSQIMKQRYPQVITLSPLDKCVVPCVNATYHYASDVADMMLKHHSTAPFAMSWFRRYNKKFQFSLRSTDDRVDVSKIAKPFGGGGHRNAAGFELENYDDLQNLFERN